MTVLTQRISAYYSFRVPFVLTVERKKNKTAAFYVLSSFFLRVCFLYLCQKNNHMAYVNKAQLLSKKLAHSHTTASPKLFALRSEPCGVKNLDLLTLSNAQQQLGKFRIGLEVYPTIVYMLFTYGLRISEVLSIRWCHVICYGKVVVHGKKRSNNRILDLGVLSDFFNSAVGSNELVFHGISRFSVRRWMLRHGFYLRLHNNSKTISTHMGRHLQLMVMRSSGVDVLDSKAYIGHKSVKSTEHYQKGRISKGGNFSK